MPTVAIHLQSTVVLLVTALCAPSLFAQRTVDTDPILHRVDSAAQADPHGYEWLAWSTAHIGHRLTGSINGERAEDLADSLLRASNIPVARFGFEASAWSRGDLTVELIASSGRRALSAVALANTPTEAAVTASLIDAGNGMPEDLARLGPALSGKAVLVNLGLKDAPPGSSNLHRSEKTSLALNAGAAAVVFVNDVHGGVLLTGTASLDGALVRAPAVCISHEDGELIRGRLSASEELSVSVHMTNRSDRVVAHNIIGEIRGTVYPEEIIVVGGHLDSWDLASGATDNGLGAFSILDLARCYADLGLRPERTIRFVLFMGEEQGLLGSTALVREWERTGELDRVKCMVNLDMTGGPTGFSVVGPSGWAEHVSSINDRIFMVDTTFARKLHTGAGLHSDHQPFMLQGVPVIAPISDLGGHVYGCYHSSCDDIHLVDPRRMTDNVRYVGMLLAALANAPELPGHYTDAELREKLVEDGLEEKLRIQHEWRW